jgi:hypothetical protein
MSATATRLRGCRSSNREPQPNLLIDSPDPPIPRCAVRLSASTTLCLILALFCRSAIPRRNRLRKRSPSTGYQVAAGSGQPRSRSVETAQPPRFDDPLQEGADAPVGRRRGARSLPMEGTHWHVRLTLTLLRGGLREPKAPLPLRTAGEGKQELLPDLFEACRKSGRTQIGAEHILQKLHDLRGLRLAAVGGLAL